jgi:acylphosphatase
MDSTVRVHAIVTGRVQGVWFRARTQERAESLGVSGWVRNLPDGAVEAVFEGPRDAVDAVVEWCREGPDHASVDDIATREEPPEGLAGFRITG